MEPTTFEHFRDEMWYDTDVEYSTNQMMLDYDPEIHGRRVIAQKDFREEVIKLLWQERNRSAE